MLVLKVRMLTASHVARGWWISAASPLSGARKRLSALEAFGLLARAPVHAHPEIELAAPLASWEPGDPAPDFGPLAYRCKSRWTKSSAQTTVYVATKKAAQQFGGTGGRRIKRAFQATHDLHMSAIFIKKLLDAPDEAAAWVSEDVLAPERKGEKLPDAVLRNSEGQIMKVIEFAGSYSAARLKKVHEDCEIRGLPYELW